MRWFRCVGRLTVRLLRQSVIVNWLLSVGRCGLMRKPLLAPEVLSAPNDLGVEQRASACMHMSCNSELVSVLLCTP